jgi:hypothetical protein
MRIWEMTVKAPADLALCEVSLNLLLPSQVLTLTQISFDDAIRVLFWSVVPHDQLPREDR